MNFTYATIAIICTFYSLMEASSNTNSTYYCEEIGASKRITLQHIEANGVGYDKGYTSLEGFYAPFFEPLHGVWIPFIDVRTHLFNNGKPAINAGLGLRYIASRVWGVNAYYDYLRSPKYHYNQISVGLESLGRILDFRLNGYLPVGDKSSHLYDFKFAAFQGNNMLISYKQEYAFKSANAEVGAHIANMNWGAFYAATGPYYLNGKKVAFGVSARASLDIFDYICLEVNTSYDKIFKWIGQGQISLIIPFGKKEVRYKKGSSCPAQIALRKRAFQRVERNEIIPTDHKKTIKTAIDPATGAPFFFIFVNNTSSSSGTFDSPFPTLIQAQNTSSSNDIIYVYAGDGTSMGMDSGILLKNNQKLFGAGMMHTVNTTLGSITIPAQATGMPLITSTSEVITCANNNEIAALQISAPEVFGIECSNVENVSIHHNSFYVSSNNDIPESGAGVFLNNCRGNVIVNYNYFNQVISPTPRGIWLKTTAEGTNYFFTKNNFEGSHFIVSSGIEFGLGDSAPGGPLTVDNFGLIIIDKNQFKALGRKAIGGRGFSGTGKFILTDNLFTDVNANAQNSQILLRVSDSGNINFSIQNNIWKESLSLELLSLKISVLDATSSCCTTLKNNQSDGIFIAYFLDNTIGGNFRANVSGNVGNVAETGTIIPTETCP